MLKDDGRVISNFIMQALNNVPITVNYGHQTRSFCYVDDMIDALIKLMESNIIGPINLGNPEEISIKNLANKVFDLCDSSSTINYLTRVEDDPNIRCPDITLAKTSLFWEPTINLETGLIKTIRYFNSINT
jgi:UDP-glucuronate decarboxylase